MTRSARFPGLLTEWVFETGLAEIFNQIVNLSIVCINKGLIVKPLSKSLLSHSGENIT